MHPRVSTFLEGYVASLQGNNCAYKRTQSTNGILRRVNRASTIGHLCHKRIQTEYEVLRRVNRASTRRESSLAAHSVGSWSFTKGISHFYNSIIAIIKAPNLIVKFYEEYIAPLQGNNCDVLGAPPARYHRVIIYPWIGPPQAENFGDLRPLNSIFT